MKNNHVSFCILLFIGISGLLITAPGLAENQDESINDSEIRSIRSVSQSILKVRSQKRSSLEQESRALKVELDEIQAALQEVDALMSSPTVKPAKIRIDGRPKGRLPSARSNPLSEEKKNQIDVKLDLAIDKLEAERKRSQDSIDRINDRTSKKARQTSRVKDKLQNLRDEIIALKDKSQDVQKAELSRLLTRFRTQRLVESDNKDQPTISSRRVHQKRRSKQ